MIAFVFLCFCSDPRMNEVFKSEPIHNVYVLFVYCESLAERALKFLFCQRCHSRIFDFSRYGILFQIFHETLSSILLWSKEGAIVGVFDSWDSKIMVLVAKRLFQNDVQVNLSIGEIFSYTIDIFWQIFVIVLKELTPVEHISCLLNKCRQKMIKKFILSLIFFKILIKSINFLLALLQILPELMQLLYNLTDSFFQVFILVHQGTIVIGKIDALVLFHEKFLLHLNELLIQSRPLFFIVHFHRSELSL